VEHAALPTTLPVWTIAESAAVRIGSVDGAGATGFGRITGLVRLTNGTVVAAEGQALELRAFDENGAHQWTAGRGGEGPGEFLNNLTHLSRMNGDSLLVSDATGRTMVFAPSGEYGRVLRLPEALEGYNRPRVIGVLGDNRVLTASGVRTGGVNDIPKGITRGTESVALLEPSGALGAALGAFRGQESLVQVNTNAAGQISSIAVRRLVMGRAWVFAVAGTSVVAAETDRFELMHHDAAGGRTTIIRVNVPVSLVNDDERRAVLARDSNAMVSDTLPAFGTVRLDDRGHIWVQEFVPTDAGRAAGWWVLTGDGTFVARVNAPRGFDLRAFAGDQVWGIRPDDEDVPFLERRGIERE
jgi:hypothetical protein